MRFCPPEVTSSVICIAAIVVAFEPEGCLGEGKTGSPPIQKLALLVGVQHYKSKSGRFTPLRGPVNDVADIEQVLTTRFGFEQRGIKQLLNEQATHHAIIAAFQRHLIAKADNNSAVLFYFSGHGSQMKNTDGTEPDGWDETICPYDSGEGDIFDISDKEIAGLLQQLLKKTSNVTLIFDSCHSGSATRGAAVSRSAPRDERTPPPAPAYAVAARGTLGRSPVSNAKYTALFACRADQSSYELKYADTSTNRGVFTYNLVRQLRLADQNSTLRDVLDRATAAVRNDVGNEVPNSEGNLDRTPFGSPTATQEPYFLVHREDDKLSLAAGLAHGMTVGSIFDVFPQGTRSFTEGRLGQLRISKVLAFQSEVEVIGKPTPIPDLARAVEREHSFGNRPVNVCLEVKDAELRSQMEKTIRGIGGMMVVQSVEESSLVITDTPGEMTNSVSEIRLVDPSKTIEFESVSKADTTPEVMATKLRRWGSWISAVRTNNPTTVFKGEFRVSLPQKTRGTKGPLLPEQTFRNGDEIEIYVKNSSDKDLYFTVLDFSSDGTISEIYPPPGTQELLVSKGEWRGTTSVSVPSDRKRSRDILKIVLSAQPLDFSPLLTSAPSPPEVDQLLRTVSPIGKGKSDAWVTSEHVFDVVVNP